MWTQAVFHVQTSVSALKTGGTKTYEGNENNEFSQFHHFKKKSTSLFCLYLKKAAMHATRSSHSPS